MSDKVSTIPKSYQKCYVLEDGNTKFQVFYDPKQKDPLKAYIKEKIS